MRNFFRIFRNLLLLLLLAFGVWSYQNNANVRLATNNSLTTLGQKVEQLFSGTSYSPTTIKTPKEANSKSKTITKPTRKLKKGQYLWQKNEATVFIAVNHNLQLREATIEAMNAWNRTGAFTFRQVNSKKKANIRVTVIDDSDTSAAGQTSITFDQNSHYLMCANVQLNRYYLQNSWYNYSHTRIVNTAEHELGHAIGLQHTKKVSVMYPAGSYYTIQPADIQKVKQLYHEQ